ncbi:MAG: nucleoside phosphorylase [Flavobacteriales bacterium]|nr:nucleoside phosphorylase [Flavobacteriales bacterium]
MKVIKDTELILNPEKNIYHLNLSKNEIANDILIVGDQSRVQQISKHFDTIDHKIENREFVTHTGEYNGKRISALSTGIGTDNIDIVLNELDAIVNIDFDTRTINPEKKSLNIIRLGTSGALQKDVEVDSFLMATHGLGFDGLAHFYKSENIIDEKMSSAFSAHSNWPKNLANPYIVSASNKLLEQFSSFNSGITATAPGFYAPQGRELRIKPAIEDLHQKMNTFNFEENRITNFEMETSALYFLGKTLGHNTLTICAIIGNRITKQHSKNYKQTVDRLIVSVLEML